MSRAAVWTPRGTHQLYEANAKALAKSLNLKKNGASGSAPASRRASPSNRNASPTARSASPSSRTGAASPKEKKEKPTGSASAASTSRSTERSAKPPKAPKVHLALAKPSGGAAAPTAAEVAPDDGLFDKPAKLPSVGTIGSLLSKVSKLKELPAKKKRELEAAEAKRTEWMGEWKKWVNEINVPQLITESLAMPTESEADAFEYMRSLTRETVAELLEKAGLLGLLELVMKGLEKVGGQAAPSGPALAEEFKESATFCMGYGELNNFFDGLEVLLGPPMMAKDPSTGEASILRAMEVEHCEEVDSEKEFTSSNGVTTTSQLEWEFVVSPDMGRAERDVIDVETGEPTGEKLGPYPERGWGFAEAHPEWCRQPRSRDELDELLERKANSKLREQFGDEAVLITEEFLGAVLYTGPMFQKYNAVLRAKTKDEYLVGLWKKQCGKNTYTTTIHAISSAVIKLSKLSKAGKVYRGVCYGRFPDKFWSADDMGVKGGIEFGFSSTTRERPQAVHYANGGGNAPSGAAKTLVEMQMGMIDRGADIYWLSQYPHEKVSTWPGALPPQQRRVEALTSHDLARSRTTRSTLSSDLHPLTLALVPRPPRAGVPATAAHRHGDARLGGARGHARDEEPPLSQPRRAHARSGASRLHQPPAPREKSCPLTPAAPSALASPAPHAPRVPEQVLSRRRKMLMDMAKGIELEIKEALRASERLVEPAIRMLRKALLYGALNQSPEWYNNDDNFATVMQETLYLQRTLISEVYTFWLLVLPARLAFTPRLHASPAPRLFPPCPSAPRFLQVKTLWAAIDQPDLNLKGWKARGPARVMLLAGWLLCRTSPIDVSIDLQQAHLTPDDGAKLAKLMRDMPKLVTIDVRGNESLEASGARALIDWLKRDKSEKTVGRKLRSLCGVGMYGSTRIDVPKASIKPVELTILCAELETNIFAEGVSAGMGGKGGTACTSLNRRGHSGVGEWQPLVWAAKDNNLLVAAQLLDTGTDVNLQEPLEDKGSSGYAALHWAAMRGFKEMIAMLLQRGANVELQDKHANTALMLASKKGNKEVVQLLSRKGSRAYDD